MQGENPLSERCQEVSEGRVSVRCQGVGGSGWEGDFRSRWSGVVGEIGARLGQNVIVLG